MCQLIHQGPPDSFGRRRPKPPPPRRPDWFECVAISGSLLGCAMVVYAIVIKVHGH
jgi:hypothetical protein